MLILGLQGSPRRSGNTAHLLSIFLDEARRYGAQTHTLEVDRKNILPCKEYIVCEKKGYCPIKDDMQTEVYALLRAADAIIMASPIFFYNVTAQLKALIDRSQTLWARKYRFKLKDPRSKTRQGFVLSVAATRGKNLFEGVDLTAQYFFDAVDAQYNGRLTYRQIEHRHDMKHHPTAAADVKAAVKKLLSPRANRKKILFVSSADACRNQMAGAFAQLLAGDKIDAVTGGSQPAKSILPMMADVMAEKNIDMAFYRPQSVNDVISDFTPEVVIALDGKKECPPVPGATIIDWDPPKITTPNIEILRSMRDDIESRVKQLIDALDL